MVKHTEEGVLDFHFFRVTYVTWLAEGGAHVGEVQELARHSSPVLTFGVYAQGNMERKRAAVESIGGHVMIHRSKKEM